MEITAHLYFPLSRYIGTRAIVPELTVSTETRGHDYGLLRVDPYVEFDQHRMPVCLDGILAET